MKNKTTIIIILLNIKVGSLKRRVFSCFEFFFLNYYHTSRSTVEYARIAQRSISKVNITTIP